MLDYIEYWRLHFGIDFLQHHKRIQKDMILGGVAKRWKRNTERKRKRKELTSFLFGYLVYIGMFYKV